MSIESEMITVVEKQAAGAKIKSLLFGRLSTSQIIMIGLIAFAGWAYTGFMGPATLINGVAAESECVDFAKRKDVFPSDHEITTTDFRIRSSKWVVTLIAKAPGSRDVKSRTCVVDGGYVEITSILTEGFWR
jgi:hypothetical protein